MVVPKFNPSSSAARYEVAPGDVWAIGDHILACGDVGGGDGQRLLDEYGEPDFFYSDPPWSAGPAADYRKRAGRTDRIPFSQLFRGVLQVAIRSHGCAFVEMGYSEPSRKQYNVVEAEVVGHETEKYPANWQRFPEDIIRVKGGDHAHPMLPFPEHSSPEFTRDIPRQLILNCTKPGAVVTDTCNGYGLIAASAVVEGRKALCMEINPERVAGSLQRISALVGVEPKKVGSL